MGRIHQLVLILCLTTWVGVTKTYGQVHFNVLDFKAVGDGDTDDTEAFKHAWAKTCGSTGASPTMIVPEDKIYLVMPTVFQGPCKSTSLNVQVKGTIIAPQSPGAWEDRDASHWLRFESLSGLTFSGSGHINGRGSNWWNKSCKRNRIKGCTKLAPTGIRFHQCNNTVVSGLNFADGPQTHLAIYGCHNFNVTRLNVKAPETSPNTDGIHVQASRHVSIQDTVIGTGDDCISIGDRVHDLVIERIVCGPGHGISVGSLGKGGSDVLLDEIHVSHVQMFNTTNGARIKAWQGGSGSASRISFKHIKVTNVKNPIIIDQYYCDSYDECPIQKKAVHISNVTFAYITGSSKTDTAVTLNCSHTVPCTGVHLDNVNLRAVSSPDDTKVSCINVHGDTSGHVYPAITCLK